MAGPTLNVSINAAANDTASATLKQIEKQTGRNVKGLDKARAAQKRMNDAAKRGREVMKGYAAAMIVVGSALAVARRVKAFADEVVNLGDKIGKGAKQLGLSVREYQRLDHALKISGTSMEASSAAFRKFSKTARDATAGVKISRDAFERIGVSVRGADGDFRSVRDLLGDVADKFRTVTSDVERSALAQDLFGRSGANMLPFLTLGADGIAKLGDEVERLGGTMSDAGVARAEEMKDSMERLDAATRGFKITLAEEVMPTLVEYVEIWTQILGGGGARNNFGVDIERLADRMKGYGRELDTSNERLDRAIKLSPQYANELGELRAKFQALPIEQQITEQARLMAQTENMPLVYKALVNSVAGYEDQLHAAADAARDLLEVQNQTAAMMATFDVGITGDLEAAVARAAKAGTKADRKPPKPPKGGKKNTGPDFSEFERLTNEEAARDSLIRGLTQELALSKAKTEADRQALSIEQALENIRLGSIGVEDARIAGLQKQIVLQNETNRLDEVAARLRDEAIEKERAKREAYTSAGFAAADALTGLIFLGAKSEKSKRQAAALDGAIETARALAAYPDVAGMISHGAAAAQFFAIAGGVGGSGGGSRARSGSGSGSGSSPAAGLGASSGSSSPGNIVVNINGLVSNQDVAKGVEKAIHASRGTGSMGAGI